MAAGEVPSVGNAPNSYGMALPGKQFNKHQL